MAVIGMKIQPRFIEVLCLVCLESLDYLRKQTLGH